MQEDERWVEMRIKKRDFWYSIFLILILVNNILMQYSSVFTYFDELIEICCICLFIKKIRLLKSNEIKCFIIMTCILCIGWIGTAVSDYQDSVVAIIKDILLFLKFPVIALYLSINLNDKCSLINSKLIIKIIKLFTVVLLISGLASLFVDIGMSQNYDIRYGIAPFQFLYSHPTFLVYTLVFMSIVLVGNISNNKEHRLLQFTLLFLMILTMRDKAFAYVILYILIIFIIPNRKKIKPIYFVFAGAIASLVSLKKIQEYRSFSWSPRFAMYSTAIKLMMEKFPVGSGLASFGSSISGEYYSNLYYSYGISQHMGPDNYIGFSDSQWPYYFGQFGIIGGLMFVTILWKLFCSLKNRIVDRFALRPVYLMCGYLLIASLVESVFTNESGATICFAALFFSNNVRQACRRTINESKN